MESLPPVVPMQLPRPASFTFKVDDGKEKNLTQAVPQAYNQQQQQANMQSQQQQFFDLNQQLRGGLPRVSSFGQVQYNNQLASSPYNSFYAPGFHQNGGIDGVQTNNMTIGNHSSPTTQYGTDTGASPMPSQTLNKYPSMPHLDSFQHLKFLVEDEARKRKSNPNVPGNTRTLMPSESYLCMKSIIEDDLSRNGITLPTKSSSQAIQSLLEHQQEEAKWNNSYQRFHNPQGPAGMHLAGYNPPGAQYMVPGMPQQVSIDPRATNKVPVPSTKKGKSNGRRGAKASASDDRVRKTSQYRGVSFHTSSGNWRARIKVQGTSKHLGYYKNEHDAARAYDEASLEIYGENAPNNRSLREEYGKLVSSEGTASTNSNVRKVINNAKKASTSFTPVSGATTAKVTTTTPSNRTLAASKPSKPSSTGTKLHQGDTNKGSEGKTSIVQDDGENEQVMAWDEKQPIEELINIKFPASGPSPASSHPGDSLKRKSPVNHTSSTPKRPAIPEGSNPTSSFAGDSDSDAEEEVKPVKIPLNAKDPNWTL